jgi:hypothetical protein
MSVYDESHVEHVGNSAARAKIKIEAGPAAGAGFFLRTDRRPCVKSPGAGQPSYPECGIDTSGLTSRARYDADASASAMRTRSAKG